MTIYELINDTIPCSNVPLFNMMTELSFHYTRLFEVSIGPILNIEHTAPEVVAKRVTREKRKSSRS